MLLQCEVSRKINIDMWGKVISVAFLINYHQQITRFSINWYTIVWCFGGRITFVKENIQRVFPTLAARGRTKSRCDELARIFLKVLNIVLMIIVVIRSYIWVSYDQNAFNWIFKPIIKQIWKKHVRKSTVTNIFLSTQMNAGFEPKFQEKKSFLLSSAKWL